MTALTPEQEQLPRATVAALFSGGRDSSLAVARLAIQNELVQPLRFVTGTNIPSELPGIREEELRRALPGKILPAVTLSAYGLVRRVAIAMIEDDFARFSGKNLVLLGEMFALLTVGLGFCLREDIPAIAFGATSYQSDMPEQRKVAVDFFHNFTRSHGIELRTPVADCASADDVKYQLWDLGISTKSLEGISIFSDSFSFAADSVVLDYLRQKRPICDEFLQRWSTPESSPPTPASPE